MMSPFLKIIVFQRVLFGLHYKTKWRSLSILLKIYCVGYYIFNIFKLVEMTYIVWAPEICTFTVITAELTIQVFSSLVSEEKYFNDYCEAIEALDDVTDSGLTINSSVANSLFILTNMVLVSGIVGSYTADDYSFSKILGSSALYLSFGTKGVSQFPTFAILDILRLRVKYLKCFLEEAVESEISDQQKTEVLEQFSEHYRYLLETLSSTKPYPTVTVTSFLITAYLKALFIIYYAITNPAIEVTASRIIWMAMTLFEIGVISVPAVLLEMVSNEVDQIKEVLGNQLLKYKELRYRRSIYDVVEYVSVAPPTVTVWQEFTVNLALYIDFIGLCVCYCIMILQFEY